VTNYFGGSPATAGIILPVQRKCRFTTHETEFIGLMPDEVQKFRRGVFEYICAFSAVAKLRFVETPWNNKPCQRDAAGLPT